MSTQAPSSPTPQARRRRLGLLAALYVAQGVPFGFQATALPVLLRQAGLSLESIGLLGMLSLPWICKPLWAPLVDATDPLGLGQRRSWLLLMQGAQAATCALAATLDPASQTAALLGAVLAMNLFAATQDIATDGMAVDSLADGELGYGNSIQVVGYKVGMLTGGGLLVWLAGKAGWPALFVGMAVIQGVCALAVLRHQPDNAAHAGAGRIGVQLVLRTLMRVLRARTNRPLLLLCVSYKVGESMIDVLFKPLLVDAGIDTATIGLWVGSVGMVAGALGSALGGWLYARIGAAEALRVALWLRALPLVLIALCAGFGVDEPRLIVCTTLEHAAGGALTTTMFATMMASVDRRIGASHYTLLAAIEVAGKAPGPLVAGFAAQRLGYAPVMVVGVALALLPLWLIGGVRRQLAAASAEVDAGADAAGP